MLAELPNCNSREPRPAQAINAASRDTDKLPPWLKNAQESAVVARLRRDLEARGDKQYLGNNAGRVPSMVQGTSEDPETGSIVRRCAHRTKATQRTVHSLPEIDAEDINNPTMGKNEIATRAEQAQKEADRLRMELSEAKEQLDNGEMATAKLVHALVSSKRELNAAKDELEGSAAAAENAAKRAEADVATLHSELEVVRSELGGKISELHEMKPQLDLARMQLRIFQETQAERYSQAKTAEMDAERAGLDLAVANAQFGAMNKILADFNNGEHESNQRKIRHQKNTNARVQCSGKKSKGKSQSGAGKGIHGKHPRADQILKLEAELESAQNAQVVLQDA